MIQEQNYSKPGRLRRRLSMGLALVALAAVCLPGAGVAQEVAGIGVVDAGRVFQESQVGLGLLEGLKQLRENKQAEGAAKQAEAKDLQDRITQSRLALSPEKLEELQKELEDMVIDLQRFDDDARRAIDEASNLAMGEFNQQIMPVISEIGRQRGFKLIFNKFEAGLLFADEQVDITDEVIALFDEQNSAPAGEGAVSSPQDSGTGR
jgi:outer membrane protein